MKLQTSTSFRALSLNFLITKESLGFNCNTPSHTTILNWIHKIGYYELVKPKEKATDWIIILDETIQFGQEKLLVVFGVKESEIDFSRPLQFQDLVPLRIISQSRWDGEQIKSLLLDVKKELGNIKYAVGDHGSYLKSGIRLAKIKHIHDLTHKIGLTIKKIYETHTDFKDLTMKIKSMRKQFAQTKIAYLKPPKLRTKCRYRNIIILSEWSMKTISYLKRNKNNKELQNKLGWLLENEELVREYFELSKTVCYIEKECKTKGYSKETLKQCKALLEENKFQSGEILKRELFEYFDEVSGLLPKEEKILISSDIIESAFGKYKNYASSNPMAGITNLALCIAAFTSDLKENHIQEALEKTTINHVKSWTREFIGETLLQQRRKAYA